MSVAQCGDLPSHTLLLGGMEFIFLPDGVCDLAADSRGRAGVCVCRSWR